jgi:hypothetical protein
VAGAASPLPRSFYADQRQLAKPCVRLFGEVTERCVRRGSHTAVQALEKAMLDYFDQRNRNPKPFVWTADADLILGRSHAFLNVWLWRHSKVCVQVVLWHPLDSRWKD